MPHLELLSLIPVVEYMNHFLKEDLLSYDNNREEVVFWWGDSTLSRIGRPMGQLPDFISSFHSSKASIRTSLLSPPYSTDWPMRTLHYESITFSVSTVYPNVYIERFIP